MRLKFLLLLQNDRMELIFVSCQQMACESSLFFSFLFFSVLLALFFSLTDNLVT
jgi:hypothetical protein